MHELKICSTSHDKLKDGLTEHTSKKKRNKQRGKSEWQKYATKSSNISKKIHSMKNHEETTQM